jgi:NAD(P) transhydrogenase subunit alpha
METGAGSAAGFPDSEYEAKGAHIGNSPAAVREKAQIFPCVRITQATPVSAGQVLIGFCDPLGQPHVAQQIAERRATLFSMELVPRITRAQAMDALSSMASIAGYKAVLLAANELPRMFPMMMTAAGTVPPARVFIIGAGVAGLQAIATARRLGAVVSAYDVRPAVKEEIQSLGAKYVSITVAGGAGEGGYARQLDEAAIRNQREQMGLILREQDVVITTAAVPGKKAPLLITKEMVRRMAPGSVIVDLAAERGGNCELTQPGETTHAEGVTILGPLNLPATVPYHASQMYARNIAAFLKNLVKNGELHIDTADEITRETLVARNGEVVHPRVQALLGVVA